MPNSRNEAVKPMPFPGESPTVALALAAGQKYGLHPEDEKPARARPRKKAAAKKSARTAAKSTRPARKAARMAPKSAKPARSKAAPRRKGTR